MITLIVEVHGNTVFLQNVTFTWGTIKKKMIRIWSVGSNYRLEYIYDVTLFQMLRNLYVQLIDYVLKRVSNGIKNSTRSI